MHIKHPYAYYERASVYLAPTSARRSSMGMMGVIPSTMTATIPRILWFLRSKTIAPESPWEQKALSSVSLSSSVLFRIGVSPPRQDNPTHHHLFNLHFCPTLSRSLSGAKIENGFLIVNNPVTTPFGCTRRYESINSEKSCIGYVFGTTKGQGRVCDLI